MIKPATPTLIRARLGNKTSELDVICTACAKVALDAESNLSLGAQLRITFTDFFVLGVRTKPGEEFICVELRQGLHDPADFSGDIRDKPGIMLISPERMEQFDV